MKFSMYFLALCLLALSIEVKGSKELVEKRLMQLYQKLLLKRVKANFAARAYNSPSGISSSQQQTIINDHNGYRSGVNPTAKNMQKAVWDTEIAAVAQKYADTCPSGHDTDAQRRVSGYGIAIGQNLAWNYNDWTAAIKGWYDEVKDFTFNYGKTGSGDIGHFTQVVNHKAARIGCGYANCNNYPTYVCNYAFGQTSQDMKTPYASGPSCGDCPNSCDNKLCNCQGKFCKNGGTLDVNSCTCSCTDLYEGDDCSTLNCPSADPSQCGQPQPYGYPQSFCTVYNNVPTECPYMCGKCSGSSSSNQGSSNQGSSNQGSSNQGSSNQGSSSNNVNCPARDPSHCGTVWPASYCQIYSNVPDDCPYMCGKCHGAAAAACNADKSHCAYWPTSYCTIYSNVPEDCPHKCGIC